MTRITWPDCAVMYNLILVKYTHTTEGGCAGGD